MERLKYIKRLAVAHPYSYENPPICTVELWDFSRANENDEARKEAVCFVASISYGNEYCKDPERLWNLLIERGHESPLEFVREYSSVNGTYNLRSEEFDTMSSIQEVSSIDYIRDMTDVNRRHIATFKLKVPIFVARQIQRHRSFSYMEMSRRYVKGEKVGFEFWMPDGVSIRNKLYGEELAVKDIYDVFEGIEAIYENLIERGYKSEQARAFLPLGLYTQFWMQGDYKAWLNFFIHRLHPEAQEETRLVAEAMWNLLKEHQPEIIKTMADYLEEWVRDCNPMFRVAREEKAKWFRANVLKSQL